MITMNVKQPNLYLNGGIETNQSLNNGILKCDFGNFCASLRNKKNGTVLKYWYTNSPLYKLTPQF